jgi:sulfotransferase family protein
MSSRSVKSGAVSTLRAAARLYTAPTANARLLPDFLIIGAERAGTTSLYRYLAQHPQVMGVTLHRKGAHYFDTNFDKSVRWYRSHFPSRLAARGRALRTGTERVVTGEACPYYVFHPLVPERVRALLPEVRLIVMLRDPVTRAYSHYLHEVARGFEHLSFAEAIDAEAERLEGEEKRMRGDAHYRSFNHQHYSYQARGRYLEQIERWQRLFPIEQIHIIESRAFFADPDAGYREVLRFLGLAERSLGEYPQLNARSDGRLPADARERLYESFAEPNRELEEYLGRSFSWETARARHS